MIEIIPAIDILNGECVRLSQGDYEKRQVYEKDPIQAAKAFERIGFNKLHIVDLDGAKSSAPINLELVGKIKRETTLSIEFGGGIKSFETAEMVLNSGVDEIICGSIAIENEYETKKLIEKYSSMIILGVDIKGREICSRGWLERTPFSIEDFLKKYCDIGLKRVIITNIEKDGMLTGPDFNLYKQIKRVFPELSLTASGGVSGINDIMELSSIGVDSVIIGRSFYEGAFKKGELESWLQKG